MKEHFKQTAKVLKVTQVEDGVGGVNETWSVSSSIKCLITEKSGTVRALNSRNSNDSLYLMYCEASVDIAQGDRVEDEDGEIFDVTFVSNPNKLNHHFEIDLSWRSV